MPAIVVDDRTWTWSETVAASAARAALLQSLGDVGPPHVGVLLGNEPEYLFWLGAAALAGAVVVGINPTRRGEALAGDLRRTDCRVLVTDAAGAALLDGLDTGVPDERILRVDDAGLRRPGGRPRRRRAAASVVARCRPQAADLYLLLFTSGTTGAPKAVRCTQGRLASIALRSAEAYGYVRDDVAYCAMPLFHGNALMVLWGPTLVVGGTVALARRFSASGFLPDVRRYGVTTFTYVGKALAYVLATPPTPDDVDCTLRRGFGTEASVADHAAFQERFGCVLTEGYGSSEGGVAINRVPGTPTGALGLPVRGRRRGRSGVRPRVPARRIRRRRGARQRPRGGGGDRQPFRVRPVRGLLQRPGGHRRASAERLVLDRRPGLPRRRRLVLVRRPWGRLAAGRLREPDGRPHRAGARPVPRRGRGRRLRGA